MSKKYRKFPGRSLCGICREEIPTAHFTLDGIPCGHDPVMAVLETEVWEVDEQGAKVRRTLPPEDSPVGQCK
jgi:hypothetical protein